MGAHRFKERLGPFNPNASNAVLAELTGIKSPFTLQIHFTGALGAGSITINGSIYPNECDGDGVEDWQPLQAGIAAEGFYSFLEEVDAIQIKGAALTATNLYIDVSWTGEG